MKMTLAKMMLFAAMAENMLDARFNPGQRPKNDSVAYFPKRKKLKGWQKNNKR